MTMAVPERTLLGRLRRRAAFLRMSEPYAAELLEAIIEEEASRRPAVPSQLFRRESVLWAAERAAEAYFVTREAVLSRCRSRSAARARALALGLCKARYGWSSVELGKAFQLDHTTVLAALKKAQREPTWALVVAEDKRAAGG